MATKKYWVRSAGVTVQGVTVEPDNPTSIGTGIKNAIQNSGAADIEKTADQAGFIEISIVSNTNLRIPIVKDDVIGTQIDAYVREHGTIVAQKIDCSEFQNFGNQNLTDVQKAALEAKGLKVIDYSPPSPPDSP
jgi:hypothetical protein